MISVHDSWFSSGRLLHSRPRNLGCEAGSFSSVVAAALEHGAAVLEHVGALDEVERPVRVLFDQQHGHAALRRSRAALARISSTSFGATPMKGSSSSSSRGSDISARPIATICCWPPLSSPAFCLRFSFRIGKQREHCSSGSSRRPARGGGEGAHRQVLLHAHAGEQPPAFGHQRDAGREPSGAAVARWSGAPSIRDPCRRRRIQPDDRADGGGFARAVGAEQADPLAALHAQRHVPQRAQLAVVDAALSSQHRQLPRLAVHGLVARGAGRSSQVGAQHALVASPPSASGPSAISEPCSSAITRSTTCSSAEKMCSTQMTVMP